MKSSKSLGLVIGSAFAATVATTGAYAAENPFAARSLASGYMVADNDKMKDGKCGDGKCSAEHKKSGDKTREGSCHGDNANAAAGSADKKAQEGSCHADKSKEGSCHADKK